MTACSGFALIYTRKKIASNSVVSPFSIPKPRYKNCLRLQQLLPSVQSYRSIHVTKIVLRE